MTDRIAAIPTRYAGVAFRSRLEAKYAAFFDLLGWHWDYEPSDLSGWIPDFGLTGHSAAGATLLVECKPVIEDDWWVRASRKIAATGYAGGPVLIAGSQIALTERGLSPGYGQWVSSDWADPVVFCDCECGGVALDFAKNALWCPGLHATGFPRTAPAVGPDSVGRALRAWREAGNQVRWQATEGARDFAAALKDEDNS